MNSNIPVYQAEIDSGLESKIRNNSFSFASCISHDKKIITNIPKLTAKASANPDQPDLFYRYAILASVGWNKNDDIFDIENTWAARKTPTDKQLNYGHDDSYIIGHMTDNFVLSEAGELIDCTASEIPDKFDIGVGFVLYTALENEDRNKQVQEIVDGIDNDEWFVSMECKFPNFDYGLIDSKGNHKTIVRTKETSFLTKHLRIYGGTGSYDGYKIGRILKDYFFSGIGIVKNPANDRSVIFSAKDLDGFKSQGSINLKEEKNMTEEEAKRLQAQLDGAVAEIASLKKANEEFQKAKASEVDTKLSEANLAAEAAKKDAAKMKEDKDKAYQDKSKAEEALTQKTKEFDEIVAKANEIKAELDTIKSETAKAARVDKLTKAGLTSEAAEKLCVTFAGVNDEQFEELVKLNAKAKQDVKEVVKETSDFTKAEVDKTPTLVITDETETAKASERQTKLHTFLKSAIASNRTKVKGDK